MAKEHHQLASNKFARVYFEGVVVCLSQGHKGMPVGSPMCSSREPQQFTKIQKQQEKEIYQLASNKFARACTEGGGLF
jgi:hypothetical protein